MTTDSGPHHNDQLAHVLLWRAIIPSADLSRRRDIFIDSQIDGPVRYQRDIDRKGPGCGDTRRQIGRSTTGNMAVCVTNESILTMKSELWGRHGTPHHASDPKQSETKNALTFSRWRKRMNTHNKPAIDGKGKIMNRPVGHVIFSPDHTTLVFFFFSEWWMSPPSRGQLHDNRWDREGNQLFSPFLPDPTTSSLTASTFTFLFCFFFQLGNVCGTRSFPDVGRG